MKGERKNKIKKEQVGMLTPTSGTTHTHGLYHNDEMSKLNVNYDRYSTDSRYMYH